MEDRWKQINQIWSESKWLYGAAGFLLGLLAFPALQSLNSNISETLVQFVPEAVGIAFTVLIVDRFYRRINLDKENEKYQNDLFFDLRSGDKRACLKALGRLKDKEWWTDGTLKGQSLSNVNLGDFFDLSNIDIEDGKLQKLSITNANFTGANLRRVSFDMASLEGADFTDADLSGAYLDCTLDKANLSKMNLENSDLTNARLNKAKLVNTNLKNASLFNADLRGANLSGANLEGAILYYEDEMGDGAEVKIDPLTVLPDKNNWYFEMDLERFTNPSHPQFWRSHDPESPAYIEHND